MGLRRPARNQPAERDRSCRRDGPGLVTAWPRKILYSGRSLSPFCIAAGQDTHDTSAQARAGVGSKCCAAPVNRRPPAHEPVSYAAAPEYHNSSRNSERINESNQSSLLNTSSRNAYPAGCGFTAWSDLAHRGFRAAGGRTDTVSAPSDELPRGIRGLPLSLQEQQRFASLRSWGSTEGLTAMTSRICTYRRDVACSRSHVPVGGQTALGPCRGEALLPTERAWRR